MVKVVFGEYSQSKEIIYEAGNDWKMENNFLRILDSCGETLAGFALHALIFWAFIDAEPKT